MTQNKNCCCSTKCKNQKPFDKKDIQSQYVNNFMEQNQRQSSQRRRHRKAANARLSSSNENGMPTNGSQPYQSIFSKFNGLINNPHRQEYSISPSLLSMPASAHLLASNPRYPKQPRSETPSRASMESTCFKPPPNRAISKSDNTIVTTMSRSEHSTYDKCGLRHLDGEQRLDTQDVRHSQNGSTTYPAVDTDQNKIGVHKPGQLSPSNCVSFLPTASAFGCPRDEVLMNDPPPEYSDPPGYYDKYF